MSAPPIPRSLVIDGHSHIASTRFIPRAFLEGMADNIVAQSQLTIVRLTRERVMARLLGTYQDHDGDLQCERMGALGIDLSIVLLPDFTYAFPNAGMTIAEIYAEHARIRQRHAGRLVMFAGVDPRWGRDALELFVKGVEEYGFSGMKLYPPCGYRADDPELTPFYEVCEAYKLPVLIHIGPTSPVLSFVEAHPMTVDTPARRFSNIPFILAHGAVSHVEDCVQLCQYRPNVFLDLSGAQPLIAAGEPVGGLARVLHAGIGHKIIFGTDWPINQHLQLNKDLLTLVGKPAAGGKGARESRMILGGTMQRLLAEISRPVADSPARLPDLQVVT